MAVRHSFSWGMAAGHVEFDKLVVAVKDMGYEGVDLPKREDWDLIKDAGLTLSAIGGHASLRDGLNRPENHDRIEKEINENLELAQKYPIHCLICFSGDRHEDSDEKGIEVTAEGLKRVAKAAEDAGVWLAVELLNSKVNHPGYQCDTTPWGVEVVKRVDSPRVKLLYDIYHMQIMEGDLIRTIQDNHEHFAHYHTAGNPGRNDIDDSQEIYYPAVIKAINETGFDGFLGQEFTSKGDRLEALRTAIKICTVA